MLRPLFPRNHIQICCYAFMPTDAAASQEAMVYAPLHSPEATKFNTSGNAFCVRLLARNSDFD